MSAEPPCLETLAAQLSRAEEALGKAYNRKKWAEASAWAQEVMRLANQAQTVAREAGDPRQRTLGHSYNLASWRRAEALDQLSDAEAAVARRIEANRLKP